MSDILIRDLAEPTVTEIDRRAREQGLSRVEYLRRRLDAEYHATAGTPVAADDWQRLHHIAADLDDSDVMSKAWS